MEFGDTVQLHFTNDNGSIGTVDNIFVTANNGWKLSNGLTVGSKLRDIFDIYGKGVIRGKGFYGTYWEVELNDGCSITVSSKQTPWGNRANINEILDTDTISSIQISTGRHEFAFRRAEESWNRR